MKRVTATPRRVDQPEIIELTDEAPRRAWRDYRESGVPQIIGDMHLGHALAACAEVGIASRLRDGVTDQEELLVGIDPYLGSHLLRYLAIRGVIESAGGRRYWPSARGKQLLAEVSLAQIGFYVDAYGPVTSSIRSLLTGEAQYGEDVTRNGEALARHSATQFRVFHTPTVLTLLERFGVEYLLDLGCGGGQVLIDACRHHSTLRGAGLDILPEVVELAREGAAAEGLADRLTFAVADAFRPETWPDFCQAADAISGVGVLHEHFRNGENAVIELLDRYAGLLRGSVKTLILGEPELYCDDVDDDSGMYLAHIFTAQGFPRSRDRWLDLFERTQLRCRTLVYRPDAGQRLAFYDLAAR